MFGAVIHNFPEPGNYHVAVMKGKQIVGSHNLTVDDKSSAIQVNIDLAPPIKQASNQIVTSYDRKDEKIEKKIDKSIDNTTQVSRFTISPNGHVLFYVSRGAGGYAVQVNRVDDPHILFDSRQLQEGDMFAATLFRPGSYSVTNIPANTKGEGMRNYP